MAWIFCWKKKELFEYVCEIIGNKEIPKEIKGNPGGNVKNVTNCVITLCRMIGIVMQREINDELIKECDLSIRIYLRMIEELNSKIKNNDDKPIWINRSNFLSLLNLPEQMKIFGPLRLYWEGGWKGEGIIKELKEVIRDGLKKNWQENIVYINPRWPVRGKNTTPCGLYFSKDPATRINYVY